MLGIELMTCEHRPVETLVDVAARLRDRVGRLRFGAPVACAYNPLDYAWQPHARYLQQFGVPPKEVLLLGMNPGPFGMVQTGVPFGEITAVRDWLRCRGTVRVPPRTHPKRPVLGFDCPRREVSGQRLWGWAQGRFGTPEAFFARFLVWNYCPLAFVEESGRNLTPDKLPASERQDLLAVCDDALRDTVRVLRPRLVVGIGAFAEQRARQALGDAVAVGRIPHPSPASPAANRGWNAAVEEALRGLGVALPVMRARAGDLDDFPG